MEAAATAERVALAGQASGMQLELVETRAELEATQAKLAQTEAQLSKMQSQSMRLANQQRALNSQLQGAMGKMATGTKTERGYIVSLSGTAFGSGKSTLTTDAKYVLAKLSGMLLAMPGAALVIEGHTDSTGSEELNQKLSTARADAAATATLLNRQNPIARSRSAWWPGGRTNAMAGASFSRVYSTAATAAPAAWSATS